MNQLLSVGSSKSVDVVMVPNGSTKHTQDTSHLRVGTNSPPPASNLPKPPWFMNTMSKNVTSDSQEEEKNAFSNPKQRSTEQPKEKKKVRTKDKKLQKGTKGSIKQPQKYQFPSHSQDGRVETEAAMVVELSEMGYDRRRSEKALEEMHWDFAKAQALLERNKNSRLMCRNHSKYRFSKPFQDWCEKHIAQRKEGKCREMVCVHTKEFKAVHEYCSWSFGGGDFDGEFWVERCCPTKLEYTMHLELLEKLKGQLFLFHGTTWNRVESIVKNGFDRYVDRSRSITIKHDLHNEMGMIGICASSFRIASFYVDARGDNTLTGKGGEGGTILLCSCAMGERAANDDCDPYAIGWKGDKKTECCIYSDDEYILQRDFQVLPLYAISTRYPVLTCDGCHNVFEARLYPHPAEQYIDIYTCVQCPDFDYCQSCYRNDQNRHKTLKNHTFIREPRYKWSISNCQPSA